MNDVAESLWKWTNHLVRFAMVVLSCEPVWLFVAISCEQSVTWVISGTYGLSPKRLEKSGALPGFPTAK